MKFPKGLAFAGVVLILALGLTACATPQGAEEAGEQAGAEAEAAGEDVSNAVLVEDQELGEGNTVVIASVSSNAAGWMVIHADSEGGPGAVIGHAPVIAGDNSNVVVEIDTSMATETLYAMLHVDAGGEGEYEFPGEDGPATDADGNIVTPPFILTILNAVSVDDQSLGDGGTVTVASVVSSDSGWMVIHADSGGGPGAVIGHAPVSRGYNSNVVVNIDTSLATETLYAMLHVDSGAEGDYEFPGEDAPATDTDGNIVTPSFQLSTEIDY